ncbi:MAG: hypothetical protein ACK4WC_02555 [Rubrimonas sp.]
MRAIAILMLGLLAGCAAPGDRIVTTGFMPAYSPAQFAAFAAAGPLVEVRGAPADGADAQAVADVLRLPGWWPQTPFRAVSPAEAAGRQRIVIAFGWPGGLDPDRLCAGQAPEPRQTAGLEVAAAWCSGSRAGSGGRLSHPKPLTPADPQFAAVMTRLFHAIAPADDPLDRNRGGHIFIPD